MIIDTHCHIYPDKIASKASAATGNFYSLPMHYDGTVSELLDAEDCAGVDLCLVESVATTPHQVHSINKFISDTVKLYPDRFIGLGALHPDSEDIENDISELTNLGLIGVKLHPDIQGFRLDCDGCMRIFSLCEEYSLPVLIHTGDKRYDNSNPDRLIRILQTFPKLTVIGAHFGGWSIWENATMKLCDFENLYVDCSSSFYALDDDTIRKIISQYGTDKIMFGSDYPMWNPKEELDRFLGLGLSSQEEKKILYANACKIYGLTT